VPRKYGRSKAKLLKFGLAYLKNMFKLWYLRHSINAADYDFKAFDSSMPIKRYWQRKRLKIITDFVADSRSIIDIGCGSGRFITGRPYAIGLDRRINVLRFNRKTNKKLVQASLENIPFKDCSFDAVVCSEVIEHIPAEKVDFKEMGRLVKENGIFVIGTPDYGKLEWRVIEYFYKKLMPYGYASEHINKYNFSSLSDKLKNHGFQIEDYKYILNGELIIKARKVGL
jgi:ubiquinone/menaquinone biosynthesis C-methylase UbiE